MIQSSGRMKIDQMFAALAMRILSADVFKAVVSRLTLRFDRYAMLMFPFDAPWITMSLTNLTKPGKAPLSRNEAGFVKGAVMVPYSVAVMICARPSGWFLRRPRS